MKTLSKDLLAVCSILERANLIIAEVQGKRVAFDPKLFGDIRAELTAKKTQRVWDFDEPEA